MEPGNLKCWELMPEWQYFAFRLIFFIGIGQLLHNPVMFVVVCLGFALIAQFPAIHGNYLRKDDHQLETRSLMSHKNGAIVSAVSTTNSSDTWYYIYTYSDSSCSGDIVLQSSFRTDTCFQGGYSYSCSGNPHLTFT